MKNRILSSVSFLVVAAALAAPTLASPSLASAQVDTRCRPDDLLCADVGVGPIEGHLRIGPGDAPPPVVVETPPPPPPIVVAPPPVVTPPVVVVQGPPPPPPAQVVVVQAPPVREPPVVQVQTRRERRVVYDLVPTFDMGLHIDGGAMFSDRIGMGGFDAALRIRPESHVGIDIGTGFWYGSDYNSREHWEMPLRADLLIFFNPEHMFQVYAVVGGGMSFGNAGGVSTRTGYVGGRDLMWAGGEAGLGAELRLSRFFALNLDVRGFIRQQVGGGPPEFTEISGGMVRSTDTSGGVYGTLGMTFYFFGNR
ncbi:MAG: hypothetical protein U0234_13680 [Sandaracinus sp.]